MVYPRIGGLRCVSIANLREQRKRCTIRETARHYVPNFQTKNSLLIPCSKEEQKMWHMSDMHIQEAWFRDSQCLELGCYILLLVIEIDLSLLTFLCVLTSVIPSGERGVYEKRCLISARHHRKRRDTKTRMLFGNVLRNNTVAYASRSDKTR